MSKPILFSYFRSSCSWRVRIALAYKGIDYEIKPIHLVKKEQVSPEYLETNPMGQVPAFMINGNTLTQSVSILEYLEEAYPEKQPLLPKAALTRAQVREICEVIASGIQPLQNLSLLEKHSSDATVRAEWAKHWITVGFNALEKILSKSSGKYCVGDDVTLADCCLVPQIYNANRFNVDMSKYPTINRINEGLEILEAFKVSHPSAQIDCPVDLK